MTTKHTPGPWFCDERSDGDSKRYVLSESAPFPGSVAFVCLDISEAEANARLIASAPDLLDALEYIYNANRPTSYAYMPELHELTSAQFDALIVEKARAAIAKARGEE